ncbi:hypothetical protein GCM10009117_04140 [Gangjinia marincola]|uniref:YhhN-like protein n=1 Tax=Gangjinia marincola TaxID=578463 RepID=A0ABN1MDS2_9FLAO
MKKVVLALLIISFVGYFSCGILIPSENYLFFKPWITPLIFIYFYTPKHYNFTIHFLLLFIFIYIGELCFSLYNIAYFTEVGVVAYFFSYSILAYLGLSRLKTSIYQGFTTVYLILVFLISAVYLYKLVVIIQDDDQTSLFTEYFVYLNALAALTLIVVAGRYIYQYNDLKSILYFLIALGFIMSDVISAIVTYYYNSFTLNLFDRIFHYLAVFLIYFYMISEHDTKSLSVQEQLKALDEDAR